MNTRFEEWLRQDLTDLHVTRLRVDLLRRVRCEHSNKWWLNILLAGELDDLARSFEPINDWQKVVHDDELVRKRGIFLFIAQHERFDCLLAIQTKLVWQLVVI